MAGKKEMKDLQWELQAAGWRIEKGRKHTKCYHPVSGFIVMSVTPNGIYAANAARRDAVRLDKQNNTQTVKRPS